MVSHRRFSDSKSPQVSWTLHSILANLKDIVVWRVSTSLISTSFTLFSNLLGLFQVHQLQLASLLHSCSIGFLVLFALSFNITLWSVGTAKSTIREVLIFFSFLLTIIKFRRLAEIRSFVCISKLPRTLCIAFSWIDSKLYILHLFVLSNFNFLHNSQLVTFPTQPVSYSFCTNLLQSFITWLIVSSLSPQS